MFNTFPSIRLMINGKDIENNKPIFIENDIYY